MKFLLYSFLFIFSTSVHATDLKLNLKVGETYSQTYKSKNTIIQDINGMKQKVEMEISGGMDFTVNKDLGDRYSMTATYHTMEMQMKSMAGQLDFSSAKNDNNLFNQMMKSITTESFTVVMLKNGKIESISDLDKIFAKMFESFPSFSEAQKEQTQAQLKKAYGEKALLGNIQMITSILPDEEVKVGETWSKSVKLDAEMPVSLENKLTLVQANEEVVIIEGFADLAAEEKGTYVEANGMQVRYNIEGQMISSYRLDPKTNWITQGEVKQDMVGEMQIKDSPQFPGGMNMPMELSNALTIGQ